MLSINDLKNGSLVIIDGVPYEVLEIAHQHIGRGGSSAQTKIRNVKTGQVLSRNFKPSDQFEEADIEKRKITYLYGHRGSFVFVEGQNQKNKGNQFGFLRSRLMHRLVFRQWVHRR